MIVLQNIGKYYYTETSVTQALRKVNLTFEVGEFVAITGESGSGKSTLLNVISGMDTFDEGEMYFEGEPTFQYDASDWEKFRRDKIGFVFQNYNLIGHYTAIDNVKSALLIMGMSEEIAQQEAGKYLEKVGLKGMESQRASELSSGQKQRLSIARALAKNTSIIVADEPTGNLDSETGNQIIQLLKELSKDKLVLMVTHNYDQVEPYVTRKVRLHDGEVVVNIKINGEDKTESNQNDVDNIEFNQKSIDNPVQKEGKDKEESISKTKSIFKNVKSHTESDLRKKQKKISRIFARMNAKTQLGRSMLFRIFFLFTACISFIFIGQLYKNADDTYTKDYDRTIYYQKNDSRLSVRRNDGKPFTKKDLEQITSVRNVVQTDPCDLANDVNYYTKKGKDYKFTYSTRQEYGYQQDVIKNDLKPEKSPAFLKRDKFMKSSGCLTKDDLISGRLPKKWNEIVLYSADGKKDSKKEIYFTNENIMGKQNFYHNQFKVVGLLKKETSQIYFHEDMCKMMTSTVNGDQFNMEYAYDFRFQKYMCKDHFYIMINDDLKGNDARFSVNYHMDSLPANVDKGATVKSLLVGENPFYISLNKAKKGYDAKLLELSKSKQKINISSRKFNDQGSKILEVSEEFFDRYVSRESTQASVYIKNYTKTDQVMNSLKKMGYDVISTYRVSSVHYNADKVMERLIFIAISVGVLLVIVILEILILRSLMKIKIKDFFVLKSMGMELHMINRISIYEMTRYCIEALVTIILVMLLVNAAGIPFITSMMIYYGPCAYVTFLGYNLILEYVTVQMFNRLLKGRMAA